MRPIEQKNINTAPENKTIKLSLAAAQHLVKTNVENLLEDVNKVSLTTFAENENKTLILGEMLGVSKSKLGVTVLGETLKEVELKKFQVANNETYKGKTVKLGGFTKAS